MGKYNASLEYNSGAKYNFWERSLLFCIMSSLGWNETISRRIDLAKIIFQSINVSELPTRVFEHVKTVTENCYISDIIVRSFSWIKIVAEKSVIREVFQRWYYNSKVMYNQGRKYIGGAAYVIKRELYRYPPTEVLSWLEETTRFRERFSMIVSTTRLTETKERLLEKIKYVTEVLGLFDVPDYARGKFRSVAEFMNWTEKISRFRKAILTILGVAQTRFSLVAKTITRIFVIGEARTRQVLRCQLGGGEGLVKIEMFRGRDKTIEVNVRDESGQVFDLTDAVVYFMVKKSVKDTDAEAVIVKSSEISGEIVITQPTQGNCEINITSSDTQNLSVRPYCYEVVVEKNGKKYTVAMSEFILKHVVKTG